MCTGRACPPWQSGWISCGARTLALHDIWASHVQWKHGHAESSFRTWHRIGRTGRCGKTGIATTFINKNQSETVLLDLKHLLKEAKQRIPPVLNALEDPYEAMQAQADAAGQKGCMFCGGLGHRIAECPKLASQKREEQRNAKDHFGSGGFGAEM